ncbi:hypothetical protein VOLCADRAFT_96135, partial [Volvox carteri f. nagariensis]
MQARDRYTGIAPKASTPSQPSVCVQLGARPVRLGSGSRRAASGSKRATSASESPGKPDVVSSSNRSSSGGSRSSGGDPRTQANVSSLTTSSDKADADVIAAAGAAGATSTAGSAASCTAARGHRLPHIGSLAVSLAFLIDFAERHVPPSQPTWAVVGELIKPHTLQETIRYVDLPEVFRHTIPPERSDYYFISHAWGRPFREMVGLCAHYLRGAVPEDTYVWCDIFIINQHPGQQQADDLQQLRLAVQDAVVTLVCTDAAGAPFERIWCLFEMWTTLTAAADHDDSVPSRSSCKGSGSGSGGGCGEGGVIESGGAGGSVRSRSQALVVLTTGLSAAQRAKLYGQIDAATAKATVPSDKERILADIARSSGGVTAFNAAVRCALLLRPLDYESELAALTDTAVPVTHGSLTHGSAISTAEAVPPQDWDFATLDSWLGLAPSHRNYRALALLGAPGTGKSSAAAAAVKRMMTMTMSPIPASEAEEQRRRRGRSMTAAAEGPLPVAMHFCRANNLQALDPLAAMCTLAYQLCLLFPEELQSYYAFELGKGDSGGGGGRGGNGGDDGDSGSGFELRVIAGMAAAEGGGVAGGGGGGGGRAGDGGGGQDPVAAAFEALLLRPLELLWKSYEDAVQIAAAAAAAAGQVNPGSEDVDEVQAQQAETAHGAAAEAAATSPPPPLPLSSPLLPRLVILLDAIDEGDSGAVGGSHENAMLLLLQEHFPRLPPFVRLIVTARPLSHIRALLAHKFDPWVIAPEDLRPPAPVCAAALATRLSRRPELMAALQRSGAATTAADKPASGSGTGSGGGGGGGGGRDAGVWVGSLAERLWKASSGWMLFLRLSEDVLEATAAAAVAAADGSGPSPRTVCKSAQAPSPSPPSPPLEAALASVVAELEAAAAARAAPLLYSLYVRVLVAPAPAAAGGSAAAGRRPPLGAPGGEPRAALQLALLLEVLGAAREPLYLSQLKDVGLSEICSGTAITSAAGLRLGCLVNVRGYKLHGIHRSLFEWLAADGAEEVTRLLAGGGAAAGGAAGGGRGGRGLRRGHAALAAMTLRDVAASRASQAAAAAAASGNCGGGSGGGGARGPRGPDPYSLQHAVGHVLEAAASLVADGDGEAPCMPKRKARIGPGKTLLLDFYYWRCVYQDGSAAAVALAALLRHEAVFAAAGVTAAAGPTATPGTAASLAADAARWLQSYHGSLLRFPQAILQSALALPAASPIRAAALAALSPPHPPQGPATTVTINTTARPASASGAAVDAVASELHSPPSPSPPCSRPAPSSSSTGAAARRPGFESSGSLSAARVPPAAVGTVAAVAQLAGTSWPRAFPLSNPPPAWDACLLTVQSRDDKKVHMLSPVTGGQASAQMCAVPRTSPRQNHFTSIQGLRSYQLHLLVALVAGVGLIEGHTDRVYCVAVRPQVAAQTRHQTLPQSQTQRRRRGSEGADSPWGQNNPSGPLAPATATGTADPNSTAALVAGVDAETAAKAQIHVQTAAAAVVVASGSLDGHVALWDGATRIQLQQLEPGERMASPDGLDGDGANSFGFSAVEDRPTGPSARGSVDCLTFSPDGFWLAAGTSDGSIAVWSMGTSVHAVKAWIAPQAHKEAVAGLTFLELSQPEGAAGAVRMTGHRREGSEKAGVGSGLPALVLASCSGWRGEMLCGCVGGGGGEGGGSGVLLVTEPLRTLRVDSEAQTEYEATGLQTQRSVNGAADPWFICNAPAAKDSSCSAVDVEAAATQPMPQPPLLGGVAEDVNGRQSRASYRAPEHYCLAAGPGLPPGCLLAGSGSGPVVVWDVASGLLRERLRGHTDAVRCLALQAARQQAEEDLAAAAEATHTAGAAAAEAGQAQREEEQSGAVESERPQETQATTAGPPGPRVCRRPCQWQCVAVLRGHTRLVTSLSFLTSTTSSPAQAASGQVSGPSASSGSEVAPTAAPAVCRLASASVDFSIRIWQVDPAGDPRSALSPGSSCGGRGAGDDERPVGHEGFAVNTAALSPDGRLIATGADDFQVCVWDSTSGAHRRTLRCFYGRVTAVAFSRDSKRMATAAEDGTARIWSVGGFQTALLEGHPSGATAVAWAEDSSLVATGAARGNPGVQLWDARMGMRINTYRYHVSDVALLAFGSAVELPPPAPQPLAQVPSTPSPRPSSVSNGVCATATSEQAPPLAAQETPQQRHHVLLMSVDVRGLACVWDVWGGGLLHSIDHVQGAALAGSRLLWMQRGRVAAIVTFEDDEVVTEDTRRRVDTECKCRVDEIFRDHMYKVCRCCG